MSQHGWPLIITVSILIPLCSGQPADKGELLNRTLASPFFFHSKTGFVSMTRDVTAYFLKDSVVYGTRGGNFEVEFLGANRDAQLRGEERQPTLVNYFVGQRPQDWSTDLATYKDLVYQRIYPGIDAQYSFSGSRLKSAFIVAPGGDPKMVRLRYTGLRSPHIDDRGDLTLVCDRGEFREQAPTAFQMKGNTRVEVPARFAIRNDGTIGFEIGVFDPEYELNIDPLIAYSSYFGGHGDTAATAVAVDPGGNVYLAGWTDATDMPLAGPLQEFKAGSVNAFVIKLNPAGNTLLYATYIGGSGDDRAYGIAVDGGGNAYVTGSTTSANFPTQKPAQSALSGVRDSFVLKLNAAGNSLTFSTFLGGAGQESGYGVALDSQGDVYVTGDTNSSNFPVLTPFQASNRGGQDAFVTKISPLGVLLYSTYLGGSGDEHAAAIAVDSAGNAYITGGTFSTNFPTASAVQAANAGGQDAFVTKLGPSGNSLVYSTYLGGSGGALGSPEWGAGIAVDSLGHAFIAGSTSSSNFPTAAAFQSTFGGGTENAFVAEFNPLGTALIYSTYFGGSTADYGLAIALDAAGNAYVAGYTGSGDIPLATPAQATLAGSYDSFILVLNSAGNGLQLSTYYGGSGVDVANAIALDVSSNAYVAGQTSSANFPAVAPLQSTLLGSLDAFILKLQLGLPEPDFALNMSPGTAAVAAGAGASFSITVTAINSFQGAVNFAVSGLPAGVTGSFSPNDITGAGATTLTIQAGNNAAAGTYTVTVSAASGPLHHSATASLTVNTTAVLSITKSHTQNFTQAQQNATYTITVANLPNTTPTSAAVTVTDTLPSGLTLVSMNGTGWSCAAATCSRGDALPSATSYPVITVTVNVASNATSPQVNQVSVSGGGSVGANAADSTIINPFGTKFGTNVGVFESGLWLTDIGGAPKMTINDVFVWGAAGNPPVVGDWNASGTTKAGVYTGGLFFLDFTGNHQFTESSIVGWGQSGDIPVVGDWNHSGTSKIGVFSNGIWVLDLTGNHLLTSPNQIISWGAPGNIPVVGDWNGDGTSKIGVFLNSLWFLDTDGSHKLTSSKIIAWGQAGDIPVVGDWNGDGTTKIGVFQNGLWLLDFNGTHQLVPSGILFLGQAGDVPVVGDWNGSGTTKIGVFRSGTWFLDLNGNQQVISQIPWGKAGDIPVPGHW